MQLRPYIMYYGLVTVVDTWFHWSSSEDHVQLHCLPTELTETDLVSGGKMKKTPGIRPLPESEAGNALVCLEYRHRQNMRHT